MIVVSIDPGKRGCGCAVWQDDTLVRAGYADGQTAPDDALAAVVYSVAWAVDQFVRESDIPPERQEARHIVMEYPQTYGGRASQGDANDLVAVALVAGAVLGVLGDRADLVLPSMWKGQVPKRTKHGTNPIELRSRGKLTAIELSRVHLSKSNAKLGHNVWDAVGIGLWHLRR